MFSELIGINYILEFNILWGRYRFPRKLKKGKTKKELSYINKKFREKLLKRI